MIKLKTTIDMVVFFEKQFYRYRRLYGIPVKSPKFVKIS